MRLLACQQCGRHVSVHELPVEFIDPARFVCGPCMTPDEGQLELEEPAEETRGYDPAIADIGF